MAKLTPRPGIMDIDPYVGGQSKDTSFKGKLSSNESALGTSPAAIAAYTDAASVLHRYPDGGSIALREALADEYDIEAERIVCVSGSDDLLQMICRAYAGPGDEVLYSQHGFLVYPIAAMSVGATPVTAPEKDYRQQVDNILAAVTPKTKVVFVTTPSNPTGSYLTKDELARLHAGLPDNIALVIDAAYAEYVTADDFDAGLELARSSDNVLMTRTFSKIYGLAGLRLGWGYGSAQIMDVINRIRGPFNVAAPAQAAGVAALGDRDFLVAARDHNSKWLAWLTQRLTALGLFAVPSVANFVLVKFASVDEARACDLFLQDKGFFLRRMDEYGFPDHLRLTVGAAGENEGVMVAIRAYVQRPNQDSDDV
jgi:histidinol-phosphate aminotransferase